MRKGIVTSVAWRPINETKQCSAMWKNTTPNKTGTAVHGCLVPARMIWFCACVRWRQHLGAGVICGHLVQVVFLMHQSIPAAPSTRSLRQLLSICPSCQCRGPDVSQPRAADTKKQPNIVTERTHFISIKWTTKNPYLPSFFFKPAQSTKKIELGLNMNRHGTHCLNEVSSN